VLENSPCNCAMLVDSDCLVTGWGDYTVRLWKLRQNAGGSSLNLASGKFSISLSHIMRTHTDEVVCVTASRTWSIAVSGSKDGSAVIWDLNRGTYVQSIRHHPDKSEFSSINLVTINESTVCCGWYIVLQASHICASGLHRNLLQLSFTAAYYQCSTNRLT
jgi:WD40 repeat protein